MSTASQFRRKEAAAWANRCARKVRHEDGSTAAAEATRLSRETGERMATYWCAGCGGYHVGHKRKNAAPSSTQQGEGK
jgi:hypothetical protein